MTQPKLPDGPISFQGAPGANSDLACHAVFPGRPTLPSHAFEDALAVVSSGEAALAMIPIENSLAGRVADVHHLLPRSGLQIVGEHFQPIHHQLLALPGVALAELRTVRSHVHALGQCRNIIRRLGLKAEIAADTAGAAAELAEKRDPSVAVIATPLAAEIYKLSILATDIEDEAHNTTRFVVLSRDALIPPHDGSLAVTTLLFRVRNVPASLYKALGGFATNGINMTKLESYMQGGSFSATEFFADVEAHPEERRLQLALEELHFFSEEVTLLGTYPGHPYRSDSRRE